MLVEVEDRKRLWRLGATAGAVVLLVVIVACARRDGKPTGDSPISSASVAPIAIAAVTTEAGTATTAAAAEPDGYKRPEPDADNPDVVARPTPNTDATVPTTLAPPPWSGGTGDLAGRVRVDVGCAASNSAADLDAFLAERVGPVLGWDYQHVYSLGGDRNLWVFQDTFLDYTNTVSNLGDARFVHNAAMLQQGSCFSLLYGGSAEVPKPFEPGTGTKTLSNWFWPMGGELMSNGNLGVFWVEMVKDDYDPKPPDGLGWHPVRTFLAQYRPDTLERVSFESAPNPGVSPIYGYAVSSDDTHTYLFANTFEQNLAREGGYWNGPHSATAVWLGRVPRGQLSAAIEYRTIDGWSPDPGQAVPVSQRYWAENPIQPRLIDGQWVSVTAVDGYWGDHLAVDVAYSPWGPWITVDYRGLAPRGGDPKMNTYHAHLLPWRDGNGGINVSVSNNARDMLADAWSNPYRYRPNLFSLPYMATPPTLAPVASTLAPTTAPTTTTTTTTTLAPTTVARTTTTTRPPRTTTTTRPTTTRPPRTTTTTRPPRTTTTSTSTTTTTTSTTTTTTTTTTTAAPQTVSGE